MSNVGSRAVFGEKFGPGDGVSLLLPLKFQGYSRPRVGQVTAVYRRDWRGLSKLSPFPRTNHLTYSCDFANAKWMKLNATATLNAIRAPDGTMTGVRLIANAQVTPHYFENNFAWDAWADSTVHSASIYVKRDTYPRALLAVTQKNGSTVNCEFNFDDERITIGTQGTRNTGTRFGVDKLADGWFRIKINGVNVDKGFNATGVRVYPSRHPNVSDTAWSKSGASATANAGGVSPVSGWTFDSLVEQSSPTGHYALASHTFRKGRAYRFRVYVKELAGSAKRYFGVVFPTGAVVSPTRFAMFDIATGELVNSSVGNNISNIKVGQASADGTRLVEFDFTPDNDGAVSIQLRITKSTTTATESYAGDNVSGFGIAAPYCWDLNPDVSDVASGVISTSTTSFAGDGVSGVFMWGGQWETNPTSSPFIYTNAAAVTATDYAATTDGKIAFREAPQPSDTLTWDGTVEWTEHVSLLPPNATQGERAIEGATARIGDIGAPLRNLWSPSQCPVELLPWLAWALSIDGWKSYWPEHVKRARIRSAIQIQRVKGTSQSVREIVQAFGGQVVLREWWENSPPTTPHTFDMTLTLTGEGGETASAQYVDDVITEVARTKPVRSHFTFTQGASAAGGIGLFGACRAAVYARLQLNGV